MIDASRYARQVCLPEVGADGQERISAATVLVVGAGGLGCAVLPYLCAAGVGRLIVVDPDRVDVTNLHRQPLYRMTDLGNLKVPAAAATLRELNPSVGVQPVAERLTPANAASLAQEADVIVDAADNFAATYVLSDECMRLGKPLVSASVLGMRGYVGAFCARAPSYRAVFPDLPSQAATCAVAGVLGTAVGVLGTLQAHVTLALLLSLEPDVRGRLITVDLRTFRFSGFSFASAPEPAAGFRFISPGDVSPEDLTVDLRGEAEAPRTAFAGSLRIGVAHIDSLASRAPRSTRVVLCCRTGLRAWRAARRLSALGHDNVALLALGD